MAVFRVERNRGYFLEMRDEEIGAELGLSRPAVQRRRTSTLDMLRKILEE